MAEKQKHLSPYNNNLPLQDILEWDVANWSRLLQLWAPVVDTLPRNVKVLAIGERNGGLSLWLASLGFDVLCTDIDDICDRAANLHDRYDLPGKITYGILDVVNDNTHAGVFDLIVARSVIGGLKTDRADAATRSFTVQQQAVANIHRMLRPGGYFLSAENLQGNLITQLLRKMKGRPSGWRYPAYKELPVLFSSFSYTKIETFGILPTFFSGSIVNQGMYFLNRYIFDALPGNTKYIAIVIARK